MKNVIGLTDLDFCAAENKRSANNPFGTTQHNPPSNAGNQTGDYRGRELQEDDGQHTSPEMQRLRRSRHYDLPLLTPV
jgi:hypothetical protein